MAAGLLVLLLYQNAVEVTPEVAAKLQDVAFQAAREGDVVTLQEYFAAGRPVNEANPRGDTLLVVAAYAGQEPAVAVILEREGVAVDARNSMGLTALTAASFQGHVGIARRLVARGADVNLSNAAGQTALMFCRADRPRCDGRLPRRCRRGCQGHGTNRDARR